jgi:hypothetical protein
MEIVGNKFVRIGARAKFARLAANHLDDRNVSIDIGRDARGEFYDIRVREDRVAFLDALDVKPDERHLLLMVRGADAVKEKFLCGHDERAWFVAAVPEVPGVSNVATAMEALKPAAVRQSQSARKVRRRDRNRRRNAGFIRQGEWFFVPAPEFRADEELVLRDEPLQRGRNKPHMAEFLYRTGGETVYVSADYPEGLAEVRYRRLRRDDPAKFARQDWRTMVRNPQVFVRGRIAHSDHATVVLPFWHRVEMNTENRARSMRNVAFLD